MQEQNGAAASRGNLRLIPGVFIVIVLLWILLWLLFFRSTPPQPSGSHTTSTKPKTLSGSQTANNGTSGQSTHSNSGSTQLANAGAGNVVAPALTASLVGGALYQVRLRKKLSD